MSQPVCAVCRVREAPPDRSVCETCFPRRVRADTEAVPASIHARAKLWVVDSGEFEPGDGSWGVFWEPLDVKLPETAKPHCCYSEHIAFYDRSGNRLLADLVRHYNFMGLHPHLLFVAGRWREVVGGRCEFHRDQWCMRWSVATNTDMARKLPDPQAVPRA